jgi:2-polyprenyl-6-methoxyphenol hydroxylase-like FAD-dependent oxidoreductase
MDIAIIGGGIVGLTAALSLDAAGLRPVVYEAVDELRPLGVGINLLPHAVRELTELGLLEQVRRIGVEIEELRYLMTDGRDVWSEPRGLAAGYRWPQIAIHRGLFQVFLRDEVLRRLGPDALRPGHALQRFDEREGRIRLRFRGRAELASADVVIGADGIHSVVRRQLHPTEGRPLWSGVSLFRSTTRLPAGAFGATMLWAGYSAQKFIAYPIMRTGDDVVLNWVADLKTGTPGTVPDEDWNRTVDHGSLIPRYRDWRWQGVDIPAIVAAGSDVYEFPMVDRDPLPRWSYGRVTLAGDAAHPMYPIGSNGATQGIIDARVLAFHLATAPEPETALARYQDARLEPSRVVLGNRAGGPDRVLEIARERAGDPTVDLATAVPMAEREAIARTYKQLAGFDPAWLNARESYSVNAAPSG